MGSYKRSRVVEDAFFLLWNNMRMEELEKEKSDHLSSKAKQCSSPSSQWHWGPLQPLHWDSVKLPVKSLSSPHVLQASSTIIQQDVLLLQIFHIADVIVPQPSSVKTIQLIWALLIAEAFWFLFSTWVILTDCGTEWAGEWVMLGQMVLEFMVLLLLPWWCCNKPSGDQSSVIVGAMQTVMEVTLTVL